LLPAALLSLPSLLRVKANFLNRIKLFLPVQSRSKKDSDFPKDQIGSYCRRPVPREGRFAIVTDAGRDAVAAGGAEDESTDLRTAKSCGPVVQYFFRSPKNGRNA
jgi:hypothetical protein